MSKLKLSNVRLSFPSLFKKAVFEGKEGKYEATLLVCKDSQSALVTKVETAMEAFLVEKFGSAMAFKGTSTGRPTVLNCNKTPVTEDDNVFYAGCYVNAMVDFWYSDHPKGGKQCLANLLGVQFVRDGESFSAVAGDCSDDFDEVEVADDEF